MSDKLFVTIENAYKKSAWTVDKYIFEDIEVEYEYGFRWAHVIYEMTEYEYSQFLDLFPDRDPMQNEDTHNMYDFPGDADSPELNDGCWDGVDADWEDDEQEERFLEEVWELDSEETDYFVTGPLRVTVEESA